MELIGSKDPENPTASFKDYERLYGGHHPFDTKLDPGMVFTYLVEKGLFRMGAELDCPHCRLSSWTALDVLKQRMVCEMCGREFDATRQLVNGAWHYRRSGVLGAEKNAQGAIPVVLTLQQFKVNLSNFREGVYSPSLDLVPKQEAGLPRCEVDFVWVIPEPYPEKSVIVIGECKDQGRGNTLGGTEGTITARDIDNLRRVADALPGKRFSTYIVLAKLCPFTTRRSHWRRRSMIVTDAGPFFLPRGNWNRTICTSGQSWNSRGSRNVQAGPRIWQTTRRRCTSRTSCPKTYCAVLKGC